MLIVKIVGLAFIALFLVLIFKQHNSSIPIFITLTSGVLVLFTMIEPLREIINFLRDIADKANIDTIYIGIVLKILAIAYIASFSSALCKDANVDSLATQIDFSGKIMILILAIPILMAVLNSILQIM